MSKIVLILLPIFIILVGAAKDYGYFTNSINIVKTCQGPKRKDCCINTLTLSPGNIVTFDMKCVEFMNVMKAKIVASKGRQKVRLQMDKPCKHVFIRPIIMTVFNASETCGISKNTYHFNLDFTEITQKYYSGMFLYGNWTFQSTFFNDNCNFLCMDMEVNIYPKKEQ